MPKKLPALASLAPDEFSVFENMAIGAEIVAHDSNLRYVDENGEVKSERLARAIDCVRAAAIRAKDLANPQSLRNLLQNVVGPQVKAQEVSSSAFMSALVIADYLDRQPAIRKWHLSPHAERRLDLIRVEATAECVKICFRSKDAPIADFCGLTDAYEIRINDIDFDSDYLLSRQWKSQKILDSADTEFDGAPFLAALKVCDQTALLLVKWKTKWNF